MFPRTLSHSAQDALAVLGKSGVLKDAYLAGGSALALQLGHRISIDFDFFSESEFELPYIKSVLKKIGSYEEGHETPKTTVGKFNSIKFSLFHYPYPLIKPLLAYEKISIASPQDIAAMKLVAITDRGTKKDFIDLYFLSKKRFAIEEMFEFYQEKYRLFQSNVLTLLKSLQYFEDADTTDMPKMLGKISWSQVRKFFQKETIRLANKYL